MELKIVPVCRIDKFLWAIRFYKTRSLASEDIGKGRIKINGIVAKASRDVHAGDRIDMLREGLTCSVEVVQVSEQRGSSPQAHTLYNETEQSIASREAAQTQRRLHPEPALTIEQGRPTKRQRRDLDRAKQGGSGWGDRWSASMED
jgi:ribosome-associated heat shock protein Hsp15